MSPERGWPVKEEEETEKTVALWKDCPRIVRIPVSPHLPLPVQVCHSLYMYVCLSLQLRQDKGREMLLPQAFTCNPANIHNNDPITHQRCSTPGLSSSLIPQPAPAVIANTLPAGCVSQFEDTQALLVSVNASSRGLFNIRSRNMS